MASNEPAGVYEETVVYNGVTTSAGNVGGTTLIDTRLTQGTDYWKNMVVLILSGSSAKQSRRISGFTTATNTLTVDTAFASQIASGTRFAILSQHTGNGVGDATAANQTLILTDTTAILIDTIQIADGTLPASPTAGSLARYIASGGTALGTELPASTSLYAILGVGYVWDGTDFGHSVRRHLRRGLAGASATTVLAENKSLLDYLITTDNNYSTTASLNFTTEKTVFEIAVDTRYQIMSPWIDITPFTAGATITFQFYRSVAAAGATYRKAGDTITKVVGTDNPIIEFADWAHYGYTKITAISNNVGDIAVTVPFGYIKKPIE